MKFRWILFYVFLTPYCFLEADVLFNSWYETHYHGYDGGYFLFFVALAVIGLIIFVPWALINTLIGRGEKKNDK